MTPSSCVASLFFACLLLFVLPAQNGASAYASYKLGSRQIFFKTLERSQKASTVPIPATCSSIANGLGKNMLPVVHRQSPCSPLHGLPSLTAAEVLRRDTSFIRRRFSSKSPVVPAPAPAPSPSASIDIPVDGSWDPSTAPRALDYSVLVGYGTPEQQFPVFLDTTFGTSLLRCKPCASGSDDCDPAFNTARSSTFAHVACGSPDCPVKDNCSSSVCPLLVPHTTRILGTFSTDVLTLAPSTAVHDFLFACLDLDERNGGLLPEVGTLDLSRDSNSLPSRLSPSSPAFSYCLPRSPSSQGFLYLGGNAAGVGDDVVHAPLVRKNLGNPELASMYFIDLVGMRLGGEDLPIPAESLGVNGTNLDVGTTFTLLPPAAYAPLRDAFRREMAQYNCSLPGIHAGFDTCYNFTGLNSLSFPLVRLEFGNGESLVIDDQMFYYDDPAAAPFTVACLAFSAMETGDDEDAFAVIGSYTLASTEVVYDVAGGNVGFIQRSC